MMKLTEWKSLARIGISIFLLYLAIHYWPAFSGFALSFFSALTPFFLGLAIAYVVNILMAFYQRHWFPRSNNKILIRLRFPLSLTGAILTGLGIVGLSVGLVFPQFIECIELLISKIPTIAASTMDWMREVPFLSETVLPLLQEINWKSLIDQVMGVLSNGLTGVVGIVTDIVSGTITTFLGIIFALYFLVDKKRLLHHSNRIMDLYLPRAWCENARYVIAVMDNAFHSFIVGQCTEALILGCLCFVGMSIFQFPYALMISALIAVTAIIPIVGAYIGAIVGAVMILTVSPLQAIFFLIYILILQQLEGNLIYPKVVGSSIGLPAIWVLVSITAGGAVAGIGGVLCGVPLAAGLYRILRHEVKKKEALLKRASHEAEREKTEPKEESNEDHKLPH